MLGSPDRSRVGTEKFDYRLNAYSKVASAVAAGGAGLGIASPLDAEVIFTEVGVTINGPNTTLDVDIDGGVVSTGTLPGADFNLAVISSTMDGNPYFAGAVVSNLGNNEVLVSLNPFETNYSVARVGSGVTVGTPGQVNGTGSSFFSDPTYGSLRGTFLGSDAYGNWNDLGEDFIGLFFEIDGNTHYGWMNILIEDDRTVGGLELTLISFAYESIPDSEIITGLSSVVPEPSSLALLSLGAVGLSAFRKQNRGRRPTVVTQSNRRG